MDSDSLLTVAQPDLRFPFELNKQLSCSIRLSNNTETPVAYKLLSTNPKIYGVQPRIGLVSPGSACDIRVTKQAMRKAPRNMMCKDKFMILTAAASPGATIDDAHNMFNQQPRHDFKECKLRVVYIPPPPPPEVHIPPQPEVPPPVPAMSPSGESADVNADSSSEVDGSGVQPRDDTSQPNNTESTAEENDCQGQQENDGSDFWISIVKGIIACLMVAVSWYLMKPTLSLIWSLTMLLSMLTIKMIKKLVSESVEDWIVKTLLYVFMHLLFKRKENIRLSKD